MTSFPLSSITETELSWGCYNIFVKSTVIKIRNLPALGLNVKSIRVKPIGALIGIMALGTVGLFFSSYLAAVGICLVSFGVFGIWLLPDRILLQATPKYLILYNTRDRYCCTLIYWEEIVQWQYEWHPSYDLLALTMVDESVQTIEVYSKRSIAKIFQEYAPGKEIRSTRIKEETV